jgi:hypothetical protein
VARASVISARVGLLGDLGRLTTLFMWLLRTNARMTGTYWTRSLGVSSSVMARWALGCKMPTSPSTITGADAVDTKYVRLQSG